MNTPPTGADVFHEIERAMVRSSDPQVARMAQSSRVQDFMDTQRHKVERGEWTPSSYYLDRLRLSWSSQWRNSHPIARAQVKNCLANVGVRVAHAEQMKGLWGQLREVDDHIGIGDTIKKTTEFASRLTGRRKESATPTPTPERSSLRR